MPLLSELFCALCRCCSSVGRMGGRQTLSLKDYCADPGVAIHELGHLVGFWHEQTRPDRDHFIKVFWDNIITSQHLNFEKREHIEIESFGRPYDLQSIMHYSPVSFCWKKLIMLETLKQDWNKKYVAMYEIESQCFWIFVFMLHRHLINASNFRFCSLNNQSWHKLHAIASIDILLKHIFIICIIIYMRRSCGFRRWHFLMEKDQQWKL